MPSKVRFVEKVDAAGIRWKCFETRYFAQCFIDQFFDSQSVSYPVDYGLTIVREDGGFRIYELLPWV